MINVQTANLIIKAVKKTGREPAVNKVMSTLVLRDGCINRQTAVHGIVLTVNAVPLRRRQVVRLTTASIVPELHPERIPAAIPVIVVVPIPVLQGLKTIPALWPDIPNAVRPVTDVKTALPAALLIPDLMSDLPSVGAVMLVPTPAAQVRSPCLALPIM